MSQSHLASYPGYGRSATVTSGVDCTGDLELGATVLKPRPLNKHPFLFGSRSACPLE